MNTVLASSNGKKAVVITPAKLCWSPNHAVKTKTAQIDVKPYVPNYQNATINNFFPNPDHPIYGQADNGGYDGAINNFTAADIATGYSRKIYCSAYNPQTGILTLSNEQGAANYFAISVWIIYVP